MNYVSLPILFLFAFTFSLGAQEILYKNDRMEILRLSEHTYQHVTFLETESFGKVPCNGLLVVDQGEVLVIDSPAQLEDAEMLLDWIGDYFDSKVVGVVATHFHKDCLGGMEAFHQKKIPSYGESRTLVKSAMGEETPPQIGFDEALNLRVGNLWVENRFLGRGHTEDNIVSFVEKDSVLFGGCLVKELGAGKGNLADADTLTWTKTIERVIRKYPGVKVVVPGHGIAGNRDLLDYTAAMFR